MSNNVSVQDNNIHLYFYFCWLWVLFPCQDTFLILNFPESTHCQKKWRCQDELAEGVRIVGVDIMYKNSRLPSHTIYVTYLDYIFLLLACDNCPITLNAGGCSHYYFDSVESQMDSNDIYCFEYTNLESGFASGLQ